MQRIGNGALHSVSKTEQNNKLHQTMREQIILPSQRPHWSFDPSADMRQQRKNRRLMNYVSRKENNVNLAIGIALAKACGFQISASELIRSEKKSVRTRVTITIDTETLID